MRIAAVKHCAIGCGVSTRCGSTLRRLRDLNTVCDDAVPISARTFAALRRHSLSPLFSPLRERGRIILRPSRLPARRCLRVPYS